MTQPLAALGEHVRVALADPVRLRAVRQTGLLGTPAEDVFDRLTRLAARATGAPMAVLSLLDDARQYFKSAVGLPEPLAAAGQAPLSHSLCKYVVASGAPLAVDATARHPVLRDLRQVAEHGIAAYLGVPLTRDDGQVLGALCVLDRVPRAWTREDIDALRDAAAAAASEIAQRQTHAALTHLVASGPVLVVRRDLADNSVCYVSPNFTRILGHAPDEILHRHDWPFEWMHLEDRARVAGAIEQALATGAGALELECRLRHRDGGYRWMTSSMRLRYAEDGRPAELLAYLVDITEIRQTERALRESEQRLATILELNPDALFILDTTGRITFANAAVEQLGRRDRAMVTDRRYDDPSWQMLTLDGRPLPEEEVPFVRVMRTGQPVMGAELAGRFADGPLHIVSVNAAPLRNGLGEITGVVCSVRDVTEQRLAEAALRESERRFRQLAENLDEVFWIVDEPQRGQRYLYVSPAYERVWGRPAADLLAGRHSWLDAVDPRDRDQVLATRPLAAQGPCLLEYRIVRPDGAVRWISARTFPVRDEHGRPCRLVGVARDVTEQRQLEEQLRQAGKMEAVGRLSGGIAHDFNNLLTVIRGNTQLLMGELPAEAPAREVLEEVELAAERATSLTRQLLAFSRRQVLQPRVLDLNLVVRDTDRMLRRMIGEDVELATTLDLRLGLVRVDPSQVERILMNLAANARDAMPRGGRISLATTDVELAGEAAQALGVPAGRYARLTVSDTGQGMDAATLARIFEPFFTTKEVGHGTGLGLATVYGIVQQSGGGLEVESAPGQGSVFRVYLPCAPADAPAGASHYEPDALSRGRETVLVVEDEASVRALVRKVLERQGYRVVEARNGPDAMRLCERPDAQVDLLVTDVVMPQMSGRELAQRVTSLQPRVRVLYISGYNDDAILRHGVAHAAVALLEKPFTPERLCRAVRAVLDR